MILKRSLYSKFSRPIWKPSLIWFNIHKSWTRFASKACKHIFLLNWSLWMVWLVRTIELSYTLQHSHIKEDTKGWTIKQLWLFVRYNINVVCKATINQWWWRHHSMVMVIKVSCHYFWQKKWLCSGENIISYVFANYSSSPKERSNKLFSEFLYQKEIPYSREL